MNKEKLNEQTDAGSALDQFTTAMQQLSTGLKGGGGSSPSKAVVGAQQTGQTADPKNTAPASGTEETDRGIPAAKKVGGPSKEVGTQDLAKKVKELGMDPKKAAALLQYYGIKIVKQ